MHKNEILIKAITHEKLSYRQAAQKYGVSKSLIHKLHKRWQQEGTHAYTPKKSTPKHQPKKTPKHIQEKIIKLRQKLDQQGLDAGPESLQHYLRQEKIAISKSTIYRILKKHELVPVQPQKRPHSSYIRFAASQPNGCWQSDFTHWQLANNQHQEIIAWLDDHSRYLLHITYHNRVTGKIVTETFIKTAKTHGYPASTLTDNGNVYTTRYAGATKGSKNAFETLLALEGINQKNGRPYKPTTQGKIERFWKTLKQYLAKQTPPKNSDQLQQQLKTFQLFYNTQRPHRAIARKTPETAYYLIPKAKPVTPDNKNLWRIRYDKVDNYGKVSLRWENKMLHLAVGRANNKKEVIIMQHGLEITVVTPDGEVLSEHEINPENGYQPKKTKNR